MSNVKTHLDLEVWQEARRFVKQMYSYTSDFPTEEKYGLTSQLRRSAVSVPTNIAEGAGRNGYKEYRRFLYITLGSLSEIETLLYLVEDLNLKEPDLNLVASVQKLAKMTNALIKSLSKQNY
jgi:four helix bundle protein